MKYMISWFERPQGSPVEYENAQKRILEVFRQWKAPANFKIELFVVRVGEWGGHVLVDCDDPLAVHKFCSTYPAFEFQARPREFFPLSIFNHSHRLQRAGWGKSVLAKRQSGSRSDAEFRSRSSIDKHPTAPLVLLPERQALWSGPCS